MCMCVHIMHVCARALYLSHSLYVVYVCLGTLSLSLLISKTQIRSSIANPIAELQTWIHVRRVPERKVIRDPVRVEVDPTCFRTNTRISDISCECLVLCYGLFIVVRECLFYLVILFVHYNVLFHVCFYSAFYYYLIFVVSDSLSLIN